MAFSPYDILCDCPENTLVPVPRTDIWRGTPILMIGTQKIYFDATLPPCCPILPYSIKVVAYPVDGEGTVYTLTTADAALSVTLTNGKIKGYADFQTAFGSEQYAIDLFFTTSCDTDEQRIGVIANVKVSDPCGDGPDTEFPCLELIFDADLCGIDLCSLDCDNNVLTVGGANVGYFDNSGNFVVTNPTYKNNFYVNGYITTDGNKISVVIQPGVACGTAVKWIFGGNTYSLNSCGPNDCGYYV